jgi:3-deoxy-D-manno-octulosonate 8-phosphate phosphatase KdsC-like HAD superfamily phosphatase
LEKCTHGLSQNVNECLNGLIWDICPKATYVEQETVAVLKFNDGDISFLKMLSDMDIIPGMFTSRAAQDCDGSRIKLSAKECTEGVKKKRKTLRHLRKNYIDTATDKEGVTYEAGNF